MDYKFLLGTVRFNNNTYNENLNWKKRKEFVGCAYGLDKPLSLKIPKSKEIYVIEMNNETNEIMGIGKISNVIKYANRSRMYEDERRNNFIYKSKYWISKTDIIKTQPKGNIVIELLENMLFKGAKHFKRGQGCVILPWDRILTIENIIHKKREYRCKICGLKMKGHVCPGRRVKMKELNKRCPLCNEIKKGHICKKIKKNFKLVKYIYNWFDNLFQ